jgi:hypothetical protein
MAHGEQDELPAARFGESAKQNVYVTQAVMEESAIVDSVFHEADGDWSFVHPLPDDSERFTADDIVLSCLACPCISTRRRPRWRTCRAAALPTARTTARGHANRSSRMTRSRRRPSRRAS